MQKEIHDGPSEPIKIPTAKASYKEEVLKDGQDDEGLHRSIKNPVVSGRLDKRANVRTSSKHNFPRGTNAWDEY